MTHRCDYCGLSFSGSGYSPDGERWFCCYGCRLVQRILGGRGEEGIASWILLRLGIGAFLAMNVMMLSLVLYTTAEAELGASAVRGLRWAMLALSAPAMAILGAAFVAGALRDLRRRRLSTDALIVTGAVVSFSVSAAHVISGRGAVYFDTATMLLLIVTLGKLLEASAKSRTSRAIREMMALTPPTARVLRDGREIEIPSGEVRRGDAMVVRPGERIPADGRILAGECLVEEAAFTGESRPRSCAPGDRVFGGSASCDGLITVCAEAVGAESLLAQIQRRVQEARDRRAPIERLAERASMVFVPSVWTMAFGAGFYWGAIRHDPEKAAMSALAVLVVACPCALGLATPMATCLAIGRAARAGVLIASGEALERLPQIRRVFFDKTGTLTTNQLSVAEVRVDSNGLTPDSALAWAASLESGSGHAIARGIVAEAEARGIEIGKVGDLRVVPGRGIVGTVALDGQTRRVSAGSLKLLEGQTLPESLAGDDPLTTIFLGWDGRARAAISLQDHARPEALSVVKALRERGIESAILSGDRENPTRRLADETGISEIHFEQSPDDKAAALRAARTAHGFGIAMVGDGINDAPALAEADLGIATGGGTDLAKQAGEITLLGDDLSRIPWLLDLSQSTYKIIRQNLYWAFGYNTLALLLAALGYVHPLIAATAMVGSSLAVIWNSMRLSTAPIIADNPADYCR